MGRHAVKLGFAYLMLWMALREMWLFVAGRTRGPSSSHIHRVRMFSQGKSLSVMTVGAAGSGKSETGNTLLGRSKFPVSSSMKVETVETTADLLERKSTVCRVFDTAGFLKGTVSAEELDEMMMPVAQQSERGIDAFLLTFPYGRWGLENNEAFRLFSQQFGASALNHTVVIFTKCGPKTEADIVPEMRKAVPDVLARLGMLETGPPVIGIGDLDPQRRRSDQERLLKAIMALADQSGSYDDVAAFQTVKDRRAAYNETISRVSCPDMQTALLRLLQRARDGYLQDDSKLEELVSKASSYSGAPEQDSIRQEVLRECRKVQLDNAASFFSRRIGNVLQGSFSSIFEKLRSAAPVRDFMSA